MKALRQKFGIDEKFTHVEKGLPEEVIPDLAEIAAQVVDNLLRGIAKERRGEAGSSDRTQHHDPRLQRRHPRPASAGDESPAAEVWH
jgi:hypothetical protein